VCQKPSRLTKKHNVRYFSFVLGLILQSRSPLSVCERKEKEGCGPGRQMDEANERVGQMNVADRQGR
jgi:hypothetical protein